ncbi:D-inositol-3-phosphate glycosyltransferase [Roseobacter fucihabitans]|uniref:D-inositol-3-phosphate glycosyltransferase n=1 Tax=Roseobacter fucihabitans TaxID=1537242 RepID=A0ABZ2BP66_9RHOB|nr:glycosyltransferase family 4 protein [Roseobacter litoralis]MBC6963367.1 Alpha-D-kanosaminyltransferase [Roseobacter litoralis]
MNILVICHDHPHYTTGGTEVLSHDLCQAYSTAGAKATFVAATTGLSRPDMPAGSLAKLGDDYLLRTGHYDMFTMSRMDGTTWVSSFKEIVQKTNPDVVHLHGLDRLGADLVTLLRRILPEVSIVLTLHDYQLICPNEGLLLTRPEAALCHRPSPEACNRCFSDLSIDRHVLRKAHLLGVLGMIDAFVAPSEDLKARFVAWGLEANRIHLLRNGVPEQKQAPARTVDAAARPRNRFAFFGQFAAHKGLYTLLDAASRLQASGASLRLSLHGRMFHPSKEAQARFDHAMQTAQPLVQNLGPYDRSELTDLISGSDWVVLPSLWFENAPLTVLEAQRIGRPVICTDIGGLGELVQDGVNGLCVPRGNAAALAETMALAASDIPLWERLAASVQPPPSTATAAGEHLALFDRLKRKAAA